MRFWTTGEMALVKKWRRRRKPLPYKEIAERLGRSCAAVRCFATRNELTGKIKKPVKQYSKEEDDIIRELRSQGKTVGEIHRALPTARSYDSIVGRLSRLNHEKTVH